MQETPNYNHLDVWLGQKIQQMGLSVEKFANLCGLSKASVYFYMTDRTRPDVQTMVNMCQVLGVPLEEGLAQYTPRKVGRPTTNTQRAWKRTRP